MLECLPTDHKDYPRYVTLLKEMSAKVASLQQQDGFWRASMLDPASFPGGETSGSAFFCYALAWGINNGHLDKTTYLPVVNKSWKTLSDSVHESGKLGWVQPIGADPQNTKYGNTEVYGVGAYLLAGCEMIKLQK